MQLSIEIFLNLAYDFNLRHWIEPLEAALLRGLRNLIFQAEAALS